jgi:Domain of unknown function (DUF5076)
MGRNSMTHHRYELPIPGPAAENKDAREILRIWGAGGKQRISIDTEGEGGPAGWGIVLVDLARHVAVAYEQSGEMKGTEVLDRIKRAYEAKWRKR